MCHTLFLMQLYEVVIAENLIYTVLLTLDWEGTLNLFILMRQIYAISFPINK